MERRTRSPNYPAFGLPDALEKVGQLYRNMHTHAGTREDIALGMGYASLNGSSMSAISALHKYGLIEGRGDEISVSDRSMKILHPQSSEERAAAIRAAAIAPSLFAELDERFPGKVPNTELLQNYLARKGFAQSALTSVVRSYLDTKELVEAESGVYDSQESGQEETAAVISSTKSEAPNAGPIPSSPQLAGRSLGRYDFEGGGFIQILSGGEIETEAALDMAETLIRLKRAEIESLKSAVTEPEEGDDLEIDLTGNLELDTD